MIGAEATSVVVVSETEITAKTAAGVGWQSRSGGQQRDGQLVGERVVYLCDAADGHESRTG